MTVFFRSPLFAYVGKQSQAGDLLLVTIKNSVVVYEHPSAQVNVWLPLNLKVNQHPGFTAVQLIDLNKLVGITPTGCCCNSYFLKFFIEKLVVLLPIYQNRYFRKKEFHELLKVFFNQIFPWGIIICTLCHVLILLAALTV